MPTWPWLALLTIAAVVLTSPSPVMAQEQDPFAAMRVSRPPALTPSPEFAFRTLTGDEVRLSSLRGKVVLLGFFSTT